MKLLLIFGLFLLGYFPSFCTVRINSFKLLNLAVFALVTGSEHLFNLRRAAVI